MKRHILKYARHGNGPTQYRHNPATVMKLVHKLIILSFNSYHFTFYNSGEKSNESYFSSLGDAIL